LPILPLRGWEQQDNIVSIETTAGDLEIAGPAEVAQYEQRGGDLLLKTVTVGDIGDLMTPSLRADHTTMKSRQWF